MGIAPHKQTTLTPEEYLAWEEKQTERHEFLNGRIWNMSGGSWSHNRIISSMVRELWRAIEGRSCHVLSNSQRVEVAEGNYFYPDLLVVCGNPQLGRQEAITNPLVVVEVLSPTTSLHYRTTKLRQYQTLESLQEYVLVHQESAVVEQLERSTDGRWMYSVIVGVEASLPLNSLGVELPLSRIYEDIPLQEIPTEEDTPPITETGEATS